jgi:hypothetical protein
VANSFLDCPKKVVSSKWRISLSPKWDSVNIVLRVALLLVDEEPPCFHTAERVDGVVASSKYRGLHRAPHCLRIEGDGSRGEMS